MAFPVETFEIEAQTPNVIDQEPSVLRKATPIFLGVSCLAALALFHTSSSAAGSPQGAQQLVAAEHPFGNEGSVRIHAPHGNEGSVRINGMRPSDINGVIDDANDVIDDAHGVPHMFGQERDEHGCLPTGGYVWCASRSECLQPWRTQCADLSASVQDIAQEVASWDAARHSGTPHDNESSVRSGTPRGTPHGNEGSVRQEGDWVFVGHGGCRAAGDRAGSYNVLPQDPLMQHSIRSGEDCRVACSSMSACVGYELRGSDGRCELHTEAIVNVHPAMGYVCWSKAQPSIQV